jgi:hypothetical protein
MVFKKTIAIYCDSTMKSTNLCCVKNVFSNAVQAAP